MGRKIYNRFEILKEAAGSPCNMVYKSLDLADGSVKQLLEWTPSADAFEDCTKALGAAQDDVPEVEVFSSAPSLYIASESGTAALDALRRLQLKGLFPGEWPGTTSEMSLEEWENYRARLKEIPDLPPPGPAVAPPPPAFDLNQIPILQQNQETEAIAAPPPPPPPPPAPSPAPPPPMPPRPAPVKSTRWLTPVLAMVAVLLLAVGLGLGWKEWRHRIAEQEQRKQAEQARLIEIERQRQEDQRKGEQAKVDQPKTEQPKTEQPKTDEPKVEPEKKPSDEQQRAKELEEQKRQAEAQHQAELANARKKKADDAERLRQQKDAERREQERLAAEAEKERLDREAKAREEREAEQRRQDAARALAAQKRKEEAERQQQQDQTVRASAKAITDSFAQRQMALSTPLNNQFHRIRLVNKCDNVSISVAIRFQALDNSWVTQGWWQVDPHQEKSVPLVYSKNSTFYFFAKDFNGGTREWSGDANDLDIDVVDNPFTHLAEPIVGTNHRRVKAIRRIYSSGYGEHAVPFTCN
ncbi:MAG TPA: DUF1036 domain-containing protein [Bryobacteraceae bacterium]|nr:DUF1036 domain-containing protein [Bryobacteraceae bacterium]